MQTALYVVAGCLGLWGVISLGYGFIWSFVDAHLAIFRGFVLLALAALIIK